MMKKLSSEEFQRVQQALPVGSTVTLSCIGGYGVPAFFHRAPATIVEYKRSRIVVKSEFREKPLIVQPEALYEVCRMPGLF
jgi:hypothetical protein